MVALSDLDTARFGVVIARDPGFTSDGLAAMLAFCRGNGVRMLIGRCLAADLAAAQAMEAAGGQIMDTLIYWTRPLDRPVPPAPAAVTVRDLDAADREAVLRIARLSFRGYFGHYHADPRLDRAACDAAYMSWAERSCSEPGVASKVWVAEVDHRVAGFLTMVEHGSGEQELVFSGVDPEVQRSGIYRALIAHALIEAQAAGVASLFTSTQLTNAAVQKVWARLGFEPLRAYYTFHLWFPG